jgi:hypothetical protein
MKVANVATGGGSPTVHERGTKNFPIIHPANPHGKRQSRYKEAGMVGSGASAATSNRPWHRQARFWGIP